MKTIIYCIYEIQRWYHAFDENQLCPIEYEPFEHIYVLAISDDLVELQKKLEFYKSGFKEFQKTKDFEEKLTKVDDGNWKLNLHFEIQEYQFEHCAIPIWNRNSLTEEFS